MRLLNVQKANALLRAHLLSIWTCISTTLSGILNFEPKTENRTKIYDEKVSLISHTFEILGQTGACAPLIIFPEKNENGNVAGIKKKKRLLQI